MPQIAESDAEDENGTGMPEDYNMWDKADLIDDLVYYKERFAEEEVLVQKMKNAWKRDEHDWELDRKDWDEQRKDLWIDMHNIRASKQNELELQMHKFLEEKRALRQSSKKLGAVFNFLQFCKIFGDFSRMLWKALKFTSYYT